MPKINFNRRKVHYFAQGRGEAIVFLHGFCEDSSMWDDFIAAFPQNKIIRIDLPGFGQSETMKNPTVEMVAEVVKEVLDFLEIKKCTLVGHSMGGYVALAFAKKYASNLEGLGLFHSHPYSDSLEQKGNRFKSIEFIKKNGHIHFIKQLFPKLFPPSFVSSNRFLIHKMIHQASSFPSEGIIGGLEMMMNRPDQSEVLRQINCPVLFIVGREDEVIPMKNSLSQTALPDVADIHILDGVGHMGIFEATKPTQKIIKDFISLLPLVLRKK
ncbi:MAG TPA: alpha/beta hydrolase [Phaeodactylibacter sp.]|nr:alpha/beta hydrolase [Phaeodactylibacter sp.]